MDLELGFGIWNLNLKSWNLGSDNTWSLRPTSVLQLRKNEKKINFQTRNGNTWGKNLIFTLPLTWVIGSILINVVDILII